MSQEPLQGLLTLKEASELLKVHPNTLRAWDKKGILKAVRIGERKLRRYKREDLVKFTEHK
jgi:excisionase family DNA binding protein